MADRQRFINCSLNNIRNYNREYMYKVLEGKKSDPVIEEAWKKWTTEKGFGCKQVAAFIRSKRGDERKVDKYRGSKNPAVRRRLAGHH